MCPKHRKSRACCRMPSAYLIISFCVDVGRAACRWPAQSQKIYFTCRAGMSTWHDHFTNTGTGRFNCVHRASRVCCCCAGSVLTYRLDIARAVDAALPAVAAAAAYRRSGGRCGATARCFRPPRSISWPWKFQPLSTGGGSQVARHLTANRQPLKFPMPGPPTLIKFICNLLYQ